MKNLRGRFIIIKYCDKHSNEDEFNFWHNCKDCEKRTEWFCEECQVDYRLIGEEKIGDTLYYLHVCPKCNDLQTIKYE